MSHVKYYIDCQSPVGLAGGFSLFSEHNISNFASEDSNKVPHVKIITPKSFKQSERKMWIMTIANHMKQTVVSWSGK